MANMKKGFTLIELSIVLVIIGLLIGGILAGQSLINSAKINKTLSELANYQIITTNFAQATRYLPGDYPNGSTFGASV